MNPRILKKLSARAAPLLPILGDHREQFRADDERNYHSVFMPCREHWERSSCRPGHEPWNLWSTPRGMPRCFVTRAGRHMVMSPPSTPLPGTIMVGAMYGGEEPEWSEETAYEALRTILSFHFSGFDHEAENLFCTRRLITPTEVFAAAAEAIADETKSEPLAYELAAFR